jgi:glycerophosphoryl diester phosphodiesterase
MPSAPARRAAVAVLAALLAAAGGVAAAFDLQGHRGARGLAPENTLAAFSAALALGVSTLELDVLMTADDQVVVGHDPRLNPALARDPDGRWPAGPGPAVRSLTLAELQRWDVGRLQPGSAYAAAFPDQRPVDGERMPTLDAVFALAAARGAATVRFNIETKLSPLAPELAPEPEAFVRAVLAAAERHGVTGRITLQSFDWRTLAAARRLAPQVPTVALSAQQPRFDTIADGRWTAGLKRAEHASLPAMVAALGAPVWSPHHADLDAVVLRQARALGLAVVPWTVNDPARMEQLVELGVQGLITDRPDLARAVLQRRGLPVPPAYPPASAPRGGASPP